MNGTADPPPPLDLVPPPAQAPNLPALDPPGIIRRRHVERFFQALTASGVCLYGHQRADVWASNLRGYSIEDLQWLANDARNRGHLPHLEACLCRLQAHRQEQAQAATPSESHGPPA